jgi:hypothetical protein
MERSHSNFTCIFTNGKAMLESHIWGQSELNNSYLILRFIFSICPSSISPYHSDIEGKYELLSTFLMLLCFYPLYSAWLASETEVGVGKGRETQKRKHLLQRSLYFNRSQKTLYWHDSSKSLMGRYKNRIQREVNLKVTPFSYGLYPYNQWPAWGQVLGSFPPGIIM